MSSDTAGIGHRWQTSGRPGSSVECKDVARHPPTGGNQERNRRAVIDDKAEMNEIEPSRAGRLGCPSRRAEHAANALRRGHLTAAGEPRPRCRLRGSRVERLVASSVIVDSTYDHNITRIDSSEGPPHGQHVPVGPNGLEREVGRAGPVPAQRGADDLPRLRARRHLPAPPLFVPKALDFLEG